MKSVRFALLVVVAASVFVTSTSHVQVGNSFPQGIQLGSSSTPCDEEHAGMLRWSPDYTGVQVCAGSTEWVMLGGNFSCLGVESLLLDMLDRIRDLQVTTKKPKDLQNDIFCSGNGVLNHEDDTCTCYVDNEHGHHGGRRCQYCVNGFDFDEEDRCTVDIEAPTIDLVGNAVVYLQIGTPFAEPGVTASDNKDGNLTSSIETTGADIDGNTIGTFTVTYSVTDGAGLSTSISRTVHVTDYIDVEYIPHVRLLLAFDEADGATQFRDHSVYNWTVVTDNNAVSDDSASIDGETSLFLDDSSSLTIADAPELEMGGDDFTVELWFRAAAFRGEILTKAWFQLYVQDNGDVRLWMSSEENSDIGDHDITGSGGVSLGSISTSTWYHVVIDRHGDSFNIYRDGNVASSFTSSLTLEDNSYPWVVGDFAPSRVHFFHGWVDSLRMTIGHSRAQGNPTYLPAQLMPLTVVELNNLEDTFCSGSGNYVNLRGERCVCYSDASRGYYRLSNCSECVDGWDRDGSNKCVVDVEDPVVVLNGDATLTLSILHLGDYSDAGATATDNADGDLTSSIVVTGLPLPNTTGVTHNVTYTATDSAGNTGVAVRSIFLTTYVDPHALSVGALFPFDGASGSTAIVDIDTSPETVTVLGNAQISTAQFKFGGSSVFFDGSDAASTGVFLDHSIALEPLDNDFTVEFWSRRNANTEAEVLTKGVEFQLYNYATGETSLWMTSESGGSHDMLSRKTFGTLNVHQWYHLAVSRVGSTIYLFRDGSLVNTANVGTLAVRNSGSRWTLGNYDPNKTTYVWNGYMDDFRLTMGVGRYVSNFTPPGELSPL